MDNNASMVIRYCDFILKVRPGNFRFYQLTWRRPRALETSVKEHESFRVFICDRFVVSERLNEVIGTGGGQK